MTSLPLRRPTPADALTVTRLANLVLIPLLEGPAGDLLGRRLAVVDYTGRRTGRHHRLVVMYTTERRTVRIVVGMAGHKTWWRNFEDPRGLRLRLRGVDHDAVARVVPEQGRVVVLVDLTPDAG